MKKIYYVIIFILIIALGMIYIQLIDYQKITASLLKDNKQSIDQITELKNNTINLENQNKMLQTHILSLEENLNVQQTELENRNFIESGETNLSLDLEKKIENKQDSDNPSLTPNVKLNEENEVTGFGLQYSQKF